MDEIKRVISYIKSCREAGIDVIITVDKTCVGKASTETA